MVTGHRCPVDLVGVRMVRGRARLVRQVHAHRELLQRPHQHGHRVAEDLRARGDPERCATAIGHRVDRARRQPAVRTRHRDRHPADPEWRGAVGVRQLQPDRVTADAGEDDVADRLVVEADVGERATPGGLRAGAPARHPANHVGLASGRGGPPGTREDGNRGRQGQQQGGTEQPGADQPGNFPPYGPAGTDHGVLLARPPTPKSPPSLPIWCYSTFRPFATLTIDDGRKVSPVPVLSEFSALGRTGTAAAQAIHPRQPGLARTADS